MDCYLSGSGIYFVNDSIVANANPVKTIRTGQFDGLVRKWIGL